MCVALRRGEARVAEDLLDAAQVGPALEKVGCSGVTERVGRYVVDAREGGGLVDDRARLALVETPTATAEEHGLRRGGLDELGTTAVEPGAQRQLGRTPERDDALL